jgi:hypothetical protein
MASATDTFAPEDRYSASDKLGVGSPMRTGALRDRFNMYKSDGGELPWKEWLEENGYGADANGNAYRKVEGQ